MPAQTEIWPETQVIGLRLFMRPLFQFYKNGKLLNKHISLYIADRKLNKYMIRNKMHRKCIS